MFNVRWHEIIYEAKFFGLISFIIQCCMLLELNQYYRQSNWGALGAHSLTKFCVCVCVWGGGGDQCSHKILQRQAHHSGVCDQLVNKEALWPSQLASVSVHLKSEADT